MFNSIGRTLRLTTFGESHGTAVGGILDGCPAGIPLDLEQMRHDLIRRHVGDETFGLSFRDFATTRIETDEVIFLSGILDGSTLGTPIAFTINNSNVRPSDYTNLQTLYRPLHADMTWEKRFGRRDTRGGGRASARETVCRVVAAAFAKQILNAHGISVSAHIQSIAGITISDQSSAMEAHQKLQILKESGDTAGGTISCYITGLPAGFGNPVFDRLQSRLAYSLLSIPSARAFEFGQGFAGASCTGNQYLAVAKRQPDGILGGISDGNNICIHLALHPVGTLKQGTPCVDKDGNTHTVKPQGRHDICHVPRTVVIVEAMTALTIADLLIENKSI